MPFHSLLGGPQRSLAHTLSGSCVLYPGSKPIGLLVDVSEARPVLRPPKLGPLMQREAEKIRRPNRGIFPVGLLGWAEFFHFI